MHIWNWVLKLNHSQARLWAWGFGFWFPPRFGSHINPNSTRGIDYVHHIVLMSLPVSFKHCDKSFLQVHEVKKHVKIYDSISKVEDLRNQVMWVFENVKSWSIRRGCSWIQKKIWSTYVHKLIWKKEQMTMLIVDRSCGICNKILTSKYLKPHIASVSEWSMEEALEVHQL